MQNEYYRTYSTDLSTNKLILMDGLFCQGTFMKLLRQATFLSQHNMPPHSISDQRLANELGDLMEIGLVTSSTRQRKGTQEPFFELTEAGGTCWENERVPIWRKFGISRFSPPTSSEVELSLVCTTKELCREFERVMDSIAQVNRIRINEWQRQIVSWKSFEQLLEICISITYPFQEERKFHDEREAQRCYWGTLAQLQKFHVMSGS